MILKKLVTSILGLVFLSCSYNNKEKNLDVWTGRYDYEENPIKAVAGYYMAMKWTLSIAKNNNAYQGILEVNGQQTYIKVLTEVIGDSDAIVITYKSLIDGSNEHLNEGDTLFSLSRNPGILETRWFTLEPRLSESPLTECSCFMRVE